MSSIGRNQNFTPEVILFCTGKMEIQSRKDLLSTKLSLASVLYIISEKNVMMEIFHDSFEKLFGKVLAVETRTGLPLTYSCKGDRLMTLLMFSIARWLFYTSSPDDKPQTHSGKGVNGKSFLKLKKRLL